MGDAVRVTSCLGGLLVTMLILIFSRRVILRPLGLFKLHLSDGLM